MVYNDFGKPVIIDTPTGSTIIPAGQTGSAHKHEPENYLNATSDTHLHTVAGYPQDGEIHFIELIVRMLEDAEARNILLEAAKNRGFVNATEFNTVFFEAFVVVDGDKTQIDGSMIITLKLPPAMCNVPNGYNREFRVFHRLSDETIKEEEIVSLDLSNKIIKIKVNELSPFAIAFRDHRRPDDDSRHILPVTGIIEDDGSHTMKLLSMFAIVALGLTMKFKDRVGKDYWDEFK